LSRQRRRGPPRRAPKNVFNRGTNKEQKKPQITSPPKLTPPKIPSAPPKIPGRAPKVTSEKPESVIIESNIEEVLVEEEEITTVEKIIEEPNIMVDQILGKKEKKSRGLKEIKKKPAKPKDQNSQSEKAAALIAKSRKRAMIPIPKEVVKEVVKPTVVRKRKPAKSSYQPANRAKRLNRSRHMEYKYEMRRLLQDIDVPEEHRSNLLGTIWAKGERQTTSDAKIFLEEKMTEGAIDEEQKSRLEKVIDDYTIRR